MEYGGAPRSFAVDFAALGFLVEAPMHGYELRDRLSEGLGSLWRIASSQLYNVLRRLEEKGWIDGRIEPQAGRPSRNVHQITAQGERAFWSWASAPVVHLRDVRVELLAKIYFLRRLAPKRVDVLIDAELEVLHRLRADLEARNRIASDDKEFGALALGFRRSLVDGAIRWLVENRVPLASVRESE